jgi:hypothetical protein
MLFDLLRWRVLFSTILSYLFVFVLGAYIGRNFRRRFPHLGLPNSAPIDDGLVNAPVLLSTHVRGEHPQELGISTGLCTHKFHG